MGGRVSGSVLAWKLIISHTCLGGRISESVEHLIIALSLYPSFIILSAEKFATLLRPPNISSRSVYAHNRSTARTTDTWPARHEDRS